MMFNPDVLKDKLTLRDAVVESIKLWSYLSKNEENTKKEYFGILSDEILSDCFLCEYVKQSQRDNNMKCNFRKCCHIFNCPLKDDTLCGFGKNESAFIRWLNRSNRSAEERKKAARKIVRALKSFLKYIDKFD